MSASALGAQVRMPPRHNLQNFSLRNATALPGNPPLCLGRLVTPVGGIFLLEGTFCRNMYTLFSLPHGLQSLISVELHFV